jgi:hypothetical protein
MSDTTIKLNKFLVYILSIAFFISIILRNNIALSALVLLVPSVALMANNLKNIHLIIPKTTKIKFLYAIPICISLFCFIVSGAKDIYHLSFLGIFIITYLLTRIPDRNNINNIANAWLIIGLIHCFGIMMGLIEINFFNTNFFSNTLPNTPYSGDAKKSISGFLFGYNQAAYFLVCSLALIKFQNIFSYKYKIFIQGLFLSSLIITGSRAALMYILLVGILLLFFQKNKKVALGFIIVLSLFYMFLTNIIFAPHNSYIVGSHHYRYLLFSTHGYDLVLGAYGHYKIQALETIFNNGFFPYGIKNFESEYGFAPHNMITGNLLAGGYLYAISILFIMVLLLKDFIIIYFSGINPLTASGIILFFVESINWDFSHAMYFWLVLFLIPLFKEKCS